MSADGRRSPVTEPKSSLRNEPFCGIIRLSTRFVAWERFNDAEVRPGELDDARD
jgi:hypothetical protein